MVKNTDKKTDTEPNYQEITGVTTYPKYKECEPGDVLVEGEYLQNFQGMYGVQYKFRSRSGGFVVLGKSGNLDYKMEFVEPGSLVKITYEGEEILKTGKYKGRHCHQFSVMVAPQKDKDSKGSHPHDENSHADDILDDLIYEDGNDDSEDLDMPW